MRGGIAQHAQRLGANKQTQTHPCPIPSSYPLPYSQDPCPSATSPLPAPVLCMAHYESGFDTSFVDHNPDGSSAYGIFQLNSTWWCDSGVTPTQNLCHMECHELFNRHILDDIMCAKQIVSSQNSMNTWDSWSQHYSGHDLSEWLKGCHIYAKPYTTEINS
ncbi:sperm acrosome-associated protein 5-like [Sagmatias obliquidens]|uniref:sperm acrosome-associated protein 5-like n=1 Tax=Sagmatias obliquidens TaxID=3371155 RepID=UPI000F4401C4|nr:sperm acrosome-associated protein 5-like [Lagenorhynchus obliquidens]